MGWYVAGQASRATPPAAAEVRSLAMTARHSTPPPTDGHSSVALLGLVLVVVGLGMLFLSAGAPATAAAKWRALKLWLFRKLAWGVLLTGAFLFVDSLFRPY